MSTYSVNSQDGSVNFIVYQRETVDFKIKGKDEQTAKSVRYARQNDLSWVFDEYRKHLALFGGNPCDARK